MGWADALEAAPEPAIRLLFTAQGEAGATSDALGLVLAAGLGQTPTTSAVVLPPAGASTPPGQVRGDRVTVDGLVRTSATDTLLVAAAADDGKHVLLAVPTADVRLREVSGLDPALALVAVEGDAAAVAPAPLTQWPSALRLGRLALGHELVGAGRTMLDLARTHALDREQFGRRIGSFQAVRHRLAETLVALESAQALLEAAELDGSDLTAVMAKAAAGRAAATASRHCQQVLAGIGFTTEHRFHLFARRVLVLDQLLGSARALTLELGEQVLATRRLPPPLPL
jgi:alkylation response protein AidB-like acyl-CoA dehydrogenase